MMLLRAQSAMRTMLFVALCFGLVLTSAKAQTVKDFVTDNGLSELQHHVFSSSILRAKLTRCGADGTQAWNKGKVHYLVTHMDIGASMSESAKSGEVVVFGFAGDDYTRPRVATVVKLQHTPDDNVVYDSTGPVTYTWGANQDADLRWEVDANIGKNTTRVNTFVCGLLRVALKNGSASTDERIRDLVHVTAY